MTARPMPAYSDPAVKAAERRKAESRADRTALNNLIARVRARESLRSPAMKLTSLLDHKDLTVRARAQIDLRLMEERANAKASSAVVEEGLVETAALERARGIAVSRPKRGPVVVAARDVLKALWGSGSLTAAQFRAGRHYQTLMELADPERGLSPPSLEGGGGSGRGVSDSFAEKVEASKGELAKANGLLAAMGGGAQVVLAVGWVAGSNRPVSGLATSGHQREKYMGALGRGLTALATLWRLG